jgi:hypothetical protein
VLVNHSLLKNRVDSAFNNIKNLRDPETSSGWQGRAFYEFIVMYAGK